MATFLSLAEFLLLIFLVQAIESRGLTLKLIHTLSPDSPLYPGDISQTERIAISVQAAYEYAARVGTKVSTEALRPKLDRQGTMYLVQVGIGAFAKRRPSYYNYFLHLDTGSDLTWMQCHQCRRVRGGCFRQKPPLFPALNSSTYRPLPCGEHPLCFTGECLEGTCTYFLEYLDGANTYGFLASESLTFNSEYPNRPQTVENVVFGCGIQNTGFMESSKQNVIAGNFGMGVGEHSFLEQKSRVTLGRFSYCLPSWEAQLNMTTFLRFGADINSALTRGLKVTPLVTVWSSASYFVNLKGISVGKARLDIPPKVFFRTTDHGGCVVDSGTSITQLPPLVYQKMKETLIKNHFLRYKKVRSLGGLDVCYRFPANTRLSDLPTITLHLQDADLVFSPHHSYTLFYRTQFCLMMMSANASGMVIIGALQQANKRFVFDTLNHKLYFGDQDCSATP